MLAIGLPKGMLSMIVLTACAGEVVDCDVGPAAVWSVHGAVVAFSSPVQPAQRATAIPADAHKLRRRVNYALTIPLRAATRTSLLCAWNVEVTMTAVLATTALVAFCAVFWLVGIHIGADPERPARRGRAIPYEGDP